MVFSVIKIVDVSLRIGREIGVGVRIDGESRVGNGGNGMAYIVIRHVVMGLVNVGVSGSVLVNSWLSDEARGVLVNSWLSDVASSVGVIVTVICGGCLNILSFLDNVLAERGSVAWISVGVMMAGGDWYNKRNGIGVPSCVVVIMLVVVLVMLVMVVVMMLIMVAMMSIGDDGINTLLLITMLLISLLISTLLVSGCGGGFQISSLSSHDFSLVSIFVDTKISHGADWHHTNQLWVHLIAVGDMNLLSRGDTMLAVVIVVVIVGVNVSASLGIAVGVGGDVCSAGDMVVIITVLVIFVVLSVTTLGITSSI